MSQFTTKWLLQLQLRQALRNQGPERKGAPDAEPSEGDLHDKIETECAKRGWLTVRSRMDRPTTTRKGVCDFIIYADRGRMLHVECKSATGKVKPEQQGFIAWAGKLGHTVHVVRSLREFLEVISEKGEA